MLPVGKVLTLGILLFFAQALPAIAQTPPAADDAAAAEKKKAADDAAAAQKKAADDVADAVKKRADAEAALKKADEEVAAKKKAAEDAKNQADTGTTFAGIKFGVGLSVAYAGKSKKRIENAEVVNGIVRVTEESPTVARVLLETHFLFDRKTGYGSAGHGPFVALQPGTNDVINAIGLGWMVAFRKDVNSPTSWNSGGGLMVEPKVKVLGDGITANEPLPAGETQIRFKHTSRYALFLMSSYAF